MTNSDLQMVKHFVHADFFPVFIYKDSNNQHYVDDTNSGEFTGGFTFKGAIAHAFKVMESLEK